MDAKQVIQELIDAALPFTSSDGNVVDVTCGTIPLMDRLDCAIQAAQKLLEEGKHVPEE